MTLREIFNSILDHPIQFELYNSWTVTAWVGLGVAILLVIYVFVCHYDGDNGWHI